MSKAVFLILVLAAAGLFFWRATRTRPENGLSEPLAPIAARHETRQTALPWEEPSGQQASSQAGKATEEPWQAAGGRAAQQTAPSANYAADTPAQKLALLEEILLSRNDNDPRLDTAFNDLSPQTKRLFRNKFRQLPDERRNEQGTVVYLLGRNLKTDEDWAFLREVASAPPCLSLEDCSRQAKTEPDAHVSAGVELTLSYPAIMALKRAERILQAGTPGNAAQALQLIAAAKSSRAGIVSDLAADLERRYSRP
ncbi:MAG: hypothetical protein NDI60_00720 [Elusimicrobiales bacterium]|nr:hypothetical protein [Elusimicrobiales bacterium]